VARARAGEGPTLLDMKTHRWYGQYDADDSLAYRSQAEIDSYKAHCPIESCRARLAARGELGAEAFEPLDSEIRATIERAVEWALASPPSPLTERDRHVYADSDVR
jgi:pyruvate dehydrogenase E1 component alpha subunit